jgi:prepilin-type N-terminal cleavage/methylation domain-containing protein
MKSRFSKRTRSGFTLLELLVAMAITTLIVTVLVSITAIATDTWTRSRTELRASRQAKTMLDAMAKDFESMVTRRNNNFEWLVAKRSLPKDSGGNDPSLPSTNASELVFFTAPTDRYDGDMSKPGDVCGVGYLLAYKDPIDSNGTDFTTFVLNRHVVDPNDTFTELLAKLELLPAFDAQYRAKLQETKNFICENVYQFTVVFHVEINNPTTGAPLTVQLMVGQNGLSEFRFKGTGIVWTGTLPDRPTDIPDDLTFENLLKAGRMVGVEISLTVLSDSAINRIRKVGPPTGTGQPAKFISSNSHNYSKFIRLTSL